MNPRPRFEKEVKDNSEIAWGFELDGAREIREAI